MSECQHPDIEYDPGNYVPPYGWEQHPGHYCVDCGEGIDPDEMEERTAPDPDLARQEQKEDGLC